MNKLLLIISFTSIMVSAVLSCTTASLYPVDRNIVYLHVPASLSALLCFTVLMIASIRYLRTRNDTFDTISLASAEVAFVFATALNATGMIFARAQWNVYWTASPRLISSAILWFLSATYLLLRHSIDQKQKRKTIAAIFGIIAFLDVPLVIISARFIRDIHRPSFSFETHWQCAAFFTGLAGTALLSVILIRIRYQLLKTNTVLQKGIPQ